MKRSLLMLLMLTVVLLFGLVACNDDTTTTSSTTSSSTSSTTPPPPAAYTVTLQVDANITVAGGASQTVTAGESAVFEITFAAGYKFASASAGTYDAAAGTLTIENVTADMTVTVTSADDRYATVTLTGSMFYKATDAEGNSLSGKSQTVLKGETVIFYIAATGNRGVESVASGDYDAETGKLTFTNVTEDISCRVNVKTHVIVYHENDGTPATKTQEPSFDYYSAPNTLWDDGSFANAGKVLIEYNTKADGTGESFSLGSKVHMVSPYKAQLDLYCIWAEETPTSDFTFSSSTVKVNGKTGYAITKYNGNADTVVLPTKYNNKPVVQINAGAFENKTMKTLVTNKNLMEVKSGAFVGCSSLETMYFADSIYQIPDDAFDAATYSNFHNFYINATMAPRYTATFDGFYRVKWDRLMATEGQKRIVFISGSSSLWGINSEYLEKLLDGEYAVVNYGTIRTTSSALYFEAISNIVDDDDTIILAPECSSAYQMGGTSLGGGKSELKVFRDTEGVYNIYRNIDIANYENYFTGISLFNQARYGMDAKDYEYYPDANVSSNSGHKIRLTYPDANTIINEYGDLICKKGSKKNNTSSSTPGKTTSFDGYTYNYADNANTDKIADYAANFNKIAAIAEDNGAKVFFGFCPVNKKSLSTAASSAAQQQRYDALLAELYDFDILGSSSKHVFDYSYFYQADQHHVTDKGTVKHTYQFYLDICEAFDLEVKHDANAFKNDGIPGCAW
ncbi:MAG: leucine-rich repeat protein [Clostridia bacterium]|nr:leucine-rich repeat protein [Clostridia bacterium]